MVVVIVMPTVVPAARRVKERRPVAAMTDVRPADLGVRRG